MEVIKDHILNCEAVRGIFDLSVKFNLPSAENASKLPLGFLYEELVDWKLPVFFTVVYYVTVSIWKQFIKKETKPQPSSLLFKGSILLHNVFLCVFSALCFFNVLPRVIHNYSTRSFNDAVNILNKYLDISTVTSMGPFGNRVLATGLGFSTSRNTTKLLTLLFSFLKAVLHPSCRLITTPVLF